MVAMEKPGTFSAFIIVTDGMQMADTHNSESGARTRPVRV
jgi:hypothetical protein